MPKQWTVTSIDDAVRAFALALGVHPVTARVLMNRGITVTTAAKLYFDPVLSDIPDPFSIPGMRAGAERVIAAITRGEKIAIFGDYDVDGVAGAALLANFLKAVGNNPVIRLPHRQGHGYGVTISDVDELRSQGVGLLITVDNGTRASAEVAHANALGIDVVVTDHHDPQGSLPAAVAVINPKLAAGSSACRDLCGCAVAFMLALGLRKLLREMGHFTGQEPNLREYLDLVALGTIADVMPITGANRILVRHGLFEIARSTNPGIRALVDVAGTDVDRISPYAVAFQLAPRINAAGRLGDANMALSLLLAGPKDDVAGMARELDRANRERQKVEEKIIEEAVSRYDGDPCMSARSSIVLSSKGWHVGVIGIVAAKLVQRYAKPAIVITEDSVPARGSARSIAGLNIVDALSFCEGSLVKFGGHAMAAGLSIQKENVDAFAKEFDAVCGRQVPDGAAGRLNVDAEVAPEDMNAGLLEELVKCQPFGIGNPEPVLSMNGLEIADRRVVGTGHLKLRLRSGNAKFDAIGFGMAKDLPDNAKDVSVAFVPEFNTWNGVTSIQLRIRDMRYV